MKGNYEPCFYNVSNDWRERWSLIREFTTRWYGIKFRNRKELLPLVRRVETKLGLELPPSFKEYIMFSFDANSTRNNKITKVIRDDYEVEYFDKLSTVSLLILSEGDCFWGIEKDNLTQADPPVNIYSIRDRNLYSYPLNKSRFWKKEEFRSIYTEYTTLTSFVLQHISYNLVSGIGVNTSGYFQTGNYSFTSIKTINKLFKRKVIFDKMLIYEKQNMISIVFFSKEGNYSFMFALWKPIDEKYIPKFILDEMNDDTMRPF